METICSLHHAYFQYISQLTLTLIDTARVADAASAGNAPLYTGPFSDLFSHKEMFLDVGDLGEWSLATAFNPTNEFLKKWGDAQKVAWTAGAGWIFW